VVARSGGQRWPEHLTVTVQPKKRGDGDKAAPTASAGSIGVSSLPPLLPMPKHRLLGLSRSLLYRLAAEERITIRKIGRSSYIETASVLKLIGELPIAKIGPGSAK
jgi:hypothetical protein